MTLRDEAMGLVALLPNPQKYDGKLKALLDASEQANARIADLKVAELGAAKKLEVAETLLASLTAQADEISVSNAAATAQIEAAKNDLARREAELLELKQQHAAQVARTAGAYEP